MDLSQEKPTRSEWQNLEIPVSESEKNILKMLISGYKDPDIRMNMNVSIASFMKIAPQTEDMDAYIYTQFFQETIQGMIPKIGSVTVPVIPPVKKMKIKKGDIIRIEQMKKTVVTGCAEIYEFVLLRFLQSASMGSQIKDIYTLIQLQKTASIAHVNTFVYRFVYDCVMILKQSITPIDILFQAVSVIEQNAALIQYSDLTLYSHQKQLFELFKTEDAVFHPRLVLYIAPTGTGKTMSPLALTQNHYRVIFVCSARHVGLGLAKAAISMQKRVAFAYGCQCPEDIRLHNYAAVDYSVNKKSGAIQKVDNTNGSRVEIMICDIKSYLIAMNYMMEFHSAESLILYWDEPTITMDYETHPLHDLIHRNWTENRIPNIVLSCATLPKSTEITQTLEHFKLQFGGDEAQVQVHSIVSYDCRKSISVLDAHNFVVLPHLLFYKDPIGLQKSIQHCQENKTMLRYLDLAEIVRFLQGSFTIQELNTHFADDDIANMTMQKIKHGYLKIISDCVDSSDSKWAGMLIYLKETQCPRFASSASSSLHKIHSLGATNTIHSVTTTIPFQKMHSVAGPVPIPQPNPFSGILFTTADARTLTDGPTIYIAEDVEKIGQFYIKQTQFPIHELVLLFQKIHNNNTLQQNIKQLENQMEDQLGKENLKEKKMAKEHFSKEVKVLKSQIELQRSKIETLSIRKELIPNHEDHLSKWSTSLSGSHGKPFTSRIEEPNMVRIMNSDIHDNQKILLLLGIGIFSKTTDATYLEIIKELANEQKLFLIIASSDYIYGTNYQFCHGILGKDLLDMTQQKMIQAMGRVGRNNIQQDYTIRFRNSDLLKTLFLPMERNLEAINMSRLFS